MKLSFKQTLAITHYFAKVIKKFGRVSKVTVHLTPENEGEWEDFLGVENHGSSRAQGTGS